MLEKNCLLTVTQEQKKINPYLLNSIKPLNQIKQIINVSNYKYIWSI